MRVLHVYKTYFPQTQGGLEEVIRQICLNTRAHDVKSRVLCVSPCASPRVVRRPEAAVFRAKRDLTVASCDFSLEAPAMLRRQLRWADIVHYHFPWPFADLLHLALRVRHPSVLTYHSDIVRQRRLAWCYAPLMRRFLARMGRIVCTSPNYYATSSVLPRFEHKVEVVPIGLAPRSYPKATATRVAAARRRYGAGFFLFVGVLRYYKGLHILLDAIAGTPYRVVIVGAGPTEAALKSQAAALRLANVAFAGPVCDREKVALLELCGAVVFPSHMRTEAFGVTLLEGAMHGKPLISTEVGSGTSHVNVDGETGLVVTPASRKALRDAMAWLHTHPTEARRLGQGARRRFDRLFNGQLMGASYARIYAALHGASDAERFGGSSGTLAGEPAQAVDRPAGQC